MPRPGTSRRQRTPRMLLAGDVWTWTTLDADSKLIVGWLVGGRDAEYANTFMQYVADRLANRVQLTTDGHIPYLEAVEGAFGADVDFAQLVKLYGTAPDAEKWYSPLCALAHKRTCSTASPTRSISARHSLRDKTSRCGYICAGLPG